MEDIGYEAADMSVDDRLDWIENVELFDMKKAIEEVKERTHSGIGGFWLFGSAMAIVMSWTRNGDILYCIGHGVGSWFYVGYRAMEAWGWWS